MPEARLYLPDAEPADDFEPISFIVGLRQRLTKQSRIDQAVHRNRLWADYQDTFLADNRSFSSVPENLRGMVSGSGRHGSDSQ